ncbi:protocatechuate 3,4-dioxygenase subunit alpha [Rhodovarius lipocyclicus]|uniref:protocatechuate 3,4-dioxygenase subunit alpha n=1 Tax=Rhodovarius lipocyclicus TaxID=268410 RepID=UPI00135B4571|nr:protocatechuate 3,4-dioxygenase subunit alpha [Rhodovarius lipocyclicus]
MSLPTASQTAGPYWHLIDFPEWADLTRAGGPNAGVAGERIILTGTVTDGDGAPCADAMIELWQAGPDGAYEAGFHGFGRCATDEAGRFRFATLKPGPVPGPGNSLQAPHITLAIFARGLMHHLTTRAYFAAEPLNEADPILALVPEARRGTLLAQPVAPGHWNLDIRLQGADETVFLDI